jgi:hypothetical protein
MAPAAKPGVIAAGRPASARVADVARGATCEGREASGGASCRRERARRGGRERERLAMRGGADRAKREGAPRREAPRIGRAASGDASGARGAPVGGGGGVARGEPRRLKKNEKMHRRLARAGTHLRPGGGDRRARDRARGHREAAEDARRAGGARDRHRACEERASAPACSCVVPRCDRLEAEIGPRVYSRLSGTARRGAGAKQTLVPESRGPRLVADVTRHPVKIRILFAERPPRWFEKPPIDASELWRDVSSFNDDDGRTTREPSLSRQTVRVIRRAVYFRCEL